MTDQSMRARVARLITGDIRADDLSRLFLYARDRCDGRETVQEIGDFVAHHSERTKGILTRSARVCFATARFAAEVSGRKLDRTWLPSIIPEFLQASVQRLDIKLLRKIGLARAPAIKATAVLVTKLVDNADGTYALPVSLSRNEADLLDVLLNNWRAKPAFNGLRLCEDFFATLKSNGLISNKEAATPFLSTVVQLFAIASIHGCEAVMSDGTRIRLAVPDNFELSIHASIPVTAPGGISISISTAMFPTGLDKNEHCAPDLIARPNWNGAVELGADRRLHFLG
jgi:hypothetical protein